MQPSSAGPPDSSPESPPSRPRWESRLLAGGAEPDPRFSLANERTFLAWIRTALALLAGGVAVEAFTEDLFAPAQRILLSAVLLVLGAALALGAGVRWLRIERAMRHARPLPLPLIIPFLAGGVVVGTVVLLAATVLRGA